MLHLNNAYPIMLHGTQVLQPSSCVSTVADNDLKRKILVLPEGLGLIHLCGRRAEAESSEFTVTSLLARQNKERSVQKHAGLNAAVQLCVFGGSFAIWRNKELNAAAKGEVAKHLVSRHGKLGAISTALMLASALMAAYKTLLGKKVGPDFLWRDKVHKWLGMLSYITSGMALLSVVNGPWGKANLGGLINRRLVSAAILLVQGLTAAPWVGIPDT